MQCEIIKNELSLVLITCLPSFFEAIGGHSSAYSCKSKSKHSSNNELTTEQSSETLRDSNGSLEPTDNGVGAADRPFSPPVDL